ncbi:hypothetical protein SAMN05428944_0610 [Streptomyces sp. 1222.5]|uniref:hypothetical protein n=1 Tax=unclassified Streptomyces TaxID=2593676 RepID=UPI00089CE903|nr:MULTISPECIES: hypothetical protein [unclassified Streptomyces]PKW12149.1 hypothetical protein BX260_7485 [Streptomyces sp. 5112.2]SEB61711.1 hypothetical protein SAMN05428944_0610 [Streptomyces sp. 1222.5]
MTASRPHRYPVLPRVLGAAAAGAVLATGARCYLSWSDQHSGRACQATDSLCMTWWDVTAVP